MRVIARLLQKAQDMGLPLEKGSWLEQLTFAELDSLVNGRYPNAGTQGR
jgi:hypothetical protein